MTAHVLSLVLLLMNEHPRTGPLRINLCLFPGQPHGHPYILVLPCVLPYTAICSSFCSLPLQLRGHPHILKLVSTAFAGPEGAETDGEWEVIRNCVCVGGHAVRMLIPMASGGTHNCTVLPSRLFAIHAPSPAGFMLLEYCPGTLLELLQKPAPAATTAAGGGGGSAGLDELTVYSVFSEVCRAVAHMHAQNPPLAHR